MKKNNMEWIPHSVRNDILPFGVGWIVSAAAPPTQSILFFLRYARHSERSEESLNCYLFFIPKYDYHG